MDNEDREPNSFKNPTSLYSPCSLSFGAKTSLMCQKKNISNSSNEGFFDLLEEKYLSNLLKSHIPTKSLIRLPKTFVPELNA